MPFNCDLLHSLDDGARRAEQARAATELHLVCERLRPLYGAEVLPAEQARAVETHCRELWRRRERIANCLGPESEAQLRTDLLDLAILWANVRVRLAGPGDTDAARREALAVLAEAEALFGPSCVLFQERRAHALALGRTDEADEAGRHAAELPPRGAWEHYALGRAYLQAGDLARAAEQLDRALAIEPRRLWPNFARGVCAFRMGRPDNALASFSACVALAPESAACYCNRGRAYAELGRTDRARQDYERALELDPGHKTAPRTVGATLIAAPRKIPLLRARSCLPRAINPCRHAFPARKACRPGQAGEVTEDGRNEYVAVGAVDRGDRVRRTLPAARPPRCRAVASPSWPATIRGIRRGAHPRTVGV